MNTLNLRHRSTTGNSNKLQRWGLDSEYGVLRDLLVGPIDHFKWQASNATARNSIRQGIVFDHATARTQYNEMLDAYRSAGVTTHQLEADADLPYQIYARDSSVMTPWGPIITQMYYPTRRGEWPALLKFYQQMDIPIFDVITAGSFEGGDFMVLEPGAVLCGYSGERTSAAGFNQMKSWFEAEGWEVCAYQFDPYFLHLDVMVAMLADKLAAVCTQAVDKSLLDWFKARNIEVIDISFAQLSNLGVNVVALGNDRVILPAANTELKDKCRAHGLEVFDPDISMITPGGGGMHCMCQALHRYPA